MARLRSLYKKELIYYLKDKLNLRNITEVPTIKKITLNIGLGLKAKDKKVISCAINDLKAISGQKPIITNVKKSISSFKIRDGWPIGLKVTLRGNRMYEFLDRLITVTIPRIRDFRGLSIKSFDGRGNYNLGVKEQIAFLEIDYDKIDCIRGIDIAITTTAKNNNDGQILLKSFGFPFKL